MRKMNKDLLKSENCRNFADLNKMRMKRKKSFSEAVMGTLGLKKSCIEMFTKILGKEPEWEDITDDVLSEYVKMLLDKSDSPSRRLCLMKTLLSRNEHLFPSKNYKELLYYKQDHRCHSFSLTLEQARKVLDYYPESDEEGFVWKMFVIQMLTGAHYEDAVKLTVDNISFQGDRIFYERKDGTDISVPMHEKLKDVLPLTFNVTNTFAKRFGQYTNTLRLIFEKLNIQGTFTNSNGFTGKIHEVVTPNVALHTFATLMYNNGHDVHDIMQYMGFKTLKALYHHIPNYQKKKARNYSNNSLIPI